MNCIDRRLAARTPQNWDDIQTMMDEGCFTPMQNKAWHIAMHALGHEQRWDGSDVAAHVYHVAFSDPPLDEEQSIIGILHDVPEDTDYQIEELKENGFSRRVTDGIFAMTKQKGPEWGARGKEPYFDFMQRCSRNPDGLILKPRDIEHNMGEGRMTPKKQYVYPVALGYLHSVQAGRRAAGSCIWNYVREECPHFLQDPFFIKEVRENHRSSQRMPPPPKRALARLPA